jgi:hypothetical protein
VDTELSSAESIATPDSQISNAAIARWSSDDLRRVRIALAKYARQSGLRDPIEVLAFTQLCIRAASERLIAINSEDADAMLHEALRIASTSCGVCKQRSTNAMSTPETQNISRKSDPVQRASSIVARASEPKVFVPVPEPHSRTMPPQPLGELPDVRPTRLWNTWLQAARRSVGTLLSAMFVRSE